MGTLINFTKTIQKVLSLALFNARWGIIISTASFEVSLQKKNPYIRGQVKADARVYIPGAG